MIPVDLKIKHQKVIEQCLIDFHGYTAQGARKEVNCHYAECIQAIGRDDDLLYHEEPFTVACDLAGKSLPLKDYADQYEKLYDRIFGLS